MQYDLEDIALRIEEARRAQAARQLAMLVHFLRSENFQAKGGAIIQRGSPASHRLKRSGIKRILRELFPTPSARAKRVSASRRRSRHAYRESSG